MRSLLLLPMLLLSACAALQQQSPYLTGHWGGAHVGLVMEGGLGRLEYDCASGTIDGPVLIAPDGRFEAQGAHIPGQGGPIRVGQIFTSHRAQYSGWVREDVMELSARLENGTLVGPFTLRRNAEPQIFRCL